MIALWKSVEICKSTLPLIVKAQLANLCMMKSNRKCFTEEQNKKTLNFIVKFSTVSGVKFLSKIFF